MLCFLNSVYTTSKLYRLRGATYISCINKSIVYIVLGLIFYAFENKCYFILKFG